MPSLSSRQAEERAHPRKSAHLIKVNAVDLPAGIGVRVIGIFDLVDHHWSQRLV
mgnify:CR=1 FL=1